jgi:hypothetical protein
VSDEVGQRGLDAIEGIEVQMLGGFVQDEELGTSCDRRREHSTRALSRASATTNTGSRSAANPCSIRYPGSATIRLYPLTAA